MSVWTATLVHGNGDVERTATESLGQALAWARGIEEQRGCSRPGEYPLQSMIDVFEIRGEHGLQYGTNNHYLVIEQEEAA